MIEIRSEHLRALVNHEGAELWSLKDGAGRELMTDADPGYWTGHAPILFPIVGRLVGDRYRLRDGRMFSLPRHGFARAMAFAIAEQNDAAVHFHLSASDVTRAMWPFDFRLDLLYQLSGSVLEVRATVTNEDDTPMPFSIGFHPAFAWPLPFGGARDEHELVFDKSEPGPIFRANAAGQIMGTPEPTPVIGRTLVPEVRHFHRDALIWSELESRGVRWGVAGGRGLHVGFPDMEMLGLWQKPGADFICIEPWAGIADPEGYTGLFEAKPGIMELAPADSRSFRLIIALDHQQD